MVLFFTAANKRFVSTAVFFFCFFLNPVFSSLSQGSRDNMSVVLVCLPGAPKVSEEAVRKDAELNKYLESRVEGENGGSKPM